MVSLKKKEELIAEWPNCGFKCPGEKFACCTDDICRTEGRTYATIDGEINMLSKKDRELVESLWDEKTGWHRPDGCALPLRLRWTRCLEWNCQEKPVPNVAY